jgi:hypothetical protein
VAVEAEGRRFKPRGPPVFLGIFIPRNAPAGNHQLVAEDLMEDGTISRISNAYSLRRATSGVKVMQFAIVFEM